MSTIIANNMYKNMNLFEFAEALSESEYSNLNLNLHVSSWLTCVICISGIEDWDVFFSSAVFNISKQRLCWHYLHEMK